MRKAGFALALAACAQLTLLSSPAFADGGASAPSGASTPTTSSTPATSSESSSSSSTSSDPHKSKTGWVVLGIGAGVTIAGIVLDIVGTQQGNVAGTGAAGDADKTSNARTNFYWGGTALIVAGVVTGVIGGSMVWASGHTSARPADEDAKVDGATKAMQAAYQTAPSFTVPVLGATF